MSSRILGTCSEEVTGTKNQRHRGPGNRDAQEKTQQRGGGGSLKVAVARLKESCASQFQRDAHKGRDWWETPSTAK